MAFSLLAYSNPEVDESQEMELMIGSLSFYVGPSGSTRLSDPVKSGPSASEAERITISRSSVGSSSEVNSPVSLTAAEDMQKRVEEFDETRGKPDMEGIVVKTHDSLRDFATGSSGVSRSVHQLCVIITEAAEEKITTKAMKRSTGKSTNQGVTSRKKRRKFMSHRGVENHHVSHQSYHRSTRKLKERSPDGILIHAASAQKEAKGGKRHDYEKPR
jgi:hypothetical protein